MSLWAICAYSEPPLVSFTHFSSASPQAQPKSLEDASPLRDFDFVFVLLYLQSPFSSHINMNGSLGTLYYHFYALVGFVYINGIMLLISLLFLIL